MSGRFCATYRLHKGETKSLETSPTEKPALSAQSTHDRHAFGVEWAGWADNGARQVTREALAREPRCTKSTEPSSGASNESEITIDLDAPDALDDVQIDFYVGARRVGAFPCVLSWPMNQQLPTTSAASSRLGRNLVPQVIEQHSGRLHLKRSAVEKTAKARLRYAGVQGDAVLR